MKEHVTSIESRIPAINALIIFFFKVAKNEAALFPHSVTKTTSNLMELVFSRKVIFITVLECKIEMSKR